MEFRTPSTSLNTLWLFAASRLSRGAIKQDSCPPPRALFFFVRVSSTGRLDLLSLSFPHTEAGKLAVHEHSQYHRPLTSSNGKRWLE